MFFLLAQENGDASGFNMVMLLVQLAFALVTLVALWMVFAKAGKPGWAAIIPIYNVVVLLDIVGRPIWWVLLFFIPCVNIVVSLLVWMDLAKSFGKGGGFGIGLFLLTPIFLMLLAFGDARYGGPSVQS